MLTLPQFTQLVGSPQIAAKWYEPLVAAMSDPVKGRINTPTRIAHFISQQIHESQGFTKSREDLNYQIPALLKTFPTRITKAQATQYGGVKVGKVWVKKPNPVAIANIVYANRYENGNVASGDGWRYRGGGPTGLTFRENYRNYGKLIGVDLENHPELIEDPVIGCKVAVAFWNDNGLSDYADRDKLGIDDDRDVCAMITRRLNGGYNGLNERIELLATTKKILGI